MTPLDSTHCDDNAGKFERRHPGTRLRPFGLLEQRLALSYLRPQRVEGLVSVIAVFSFLGIVLGVAVLIIVMAVMNGFRAELKDRILGVNGHITVTAAGTASIADYTDLTTSFDAVNGVVHATAIIEGQAMAAASGRNRGVLVRGLTRDDLRAFPLIDKNIIDGTLDRFDTAKGVIIGSRLARFLGLRVGQSMTLLGAAGPDTPFGRLPRARSFPVIGTFQLGMSEYDSLLVFMPRAAAQSFFNIGDTATTIDIIISDPDQAPAFIMPLNRAAGSAPINITTWQQSNATLFSALSIERNVMFLILTFIILIAAFNILSGLIMLVRDKNRDIAILRTMGATQGFVLRVFMMTGTLIGIAGTAIGALLGVLFCRYIEEIRQLLTSLSGIELFSPEIYFLSKLPAKMETMEVVMVIMMSLILAFLATLYPAWRAARLHPARLLRHE